MKTMEELQTEATQSGVSFGRLVEHELNQLLTEMTEHRLIGESSNGRTTAFEAVNEGSTPSSPTNMEQASFLKTSYGRAVAK